MLFIEVFVFFYPIFAVISDGIPGVKIIIFLTQIILVSSLSLYLLIKKTNLKKNFLNNLKRFIF
jgi:hypothetical protein